MKVSTHHLDMGTLLAYRDHELAAGQRDTVQVHLKECEVCQRQLETLTRQAGQVEGLLGALEPTPLDAPQTRRALIDLRQETAMRSELTMWDRIRSNKRLVRALVGIAGLVIVAGLFSLAPVRALAAEFLGLFRVETFVTVSVSPERLAEIDQVLSEGMGFGEVEVVGEGGSTTVGSLEEAAGLAGFTPRAPQGFGAPTGIEVSYAQSANVTPDVAAVREVLAALDVDPTLVPDSIDGQQFTFTFPSGVMQSYVDANGNYFSVMQMPSPSVEGPEGIDLNSLGNVMLQVLGMSPEEAARLSESIDWTSTLVLPIPTNVASVREIEVDGVTGLAFEAVDSGDPDDGNHIEGGGAILWQKDGFVYLVGSGQLETPELIGIAGTLP